MKSVPAGRSAREEALLLLDEAKIDRLDLHYQAAADACEEAAGLVHSDPDLRGQCLSDQAAALDALGDEFGDNRALERAMDCYRLALEERTRERVPLKWAATQNNLGNALQVLGEREVGTGRLEEALAAYRSALKEHTRERMPLAWAMTQDNLGAVLRVLGMREAGTGRLEEAVSAYRSGRDLFASALGAEHPYTEVSQAGLNEVVQMLRRMH